jgi:hypothetical protein
MSDFFNLLRGKIEIVPERKFDREFWTKFDAEFGSEKKSFWYGISNLTLKSGFAAITIMSILSLASYKGLSSHFEKERERVFTAGTIDNKDMVADLPLFLTFDKLPTSDREWAILLPEGE